MSNKYLLQMTSINKSFPGVQALNNAHLEVRRNSVHALMGENGAGKSTLMKILAGILKMDTGEIIFEGEKIPTSNTSYMLKMGVSMIYQELSPIPMMTVLENIYVGREPRKKGQLFIDKRRMYNDAKTLLNNLNMDDIDPNSKMSDLSVAKMQMVEIAKALSYQSKLIIMDEPTSSLTDNECDNLFNIVNGLKDQGVSFIFITHKMDEVFSIADEITVMRDGEYICTKKTSELNKKELIDLMVGRELTNLFPKEDVDIGEVVLSVKKVCKEGMFKDVSFDLRKGEILGFAGLVGSGRTEIAETIFGCRKMDNGEIFINGQRVKINKPKDALKHGLALLTEDRRLNGIFPPLNLKDNMILPSINKFRKFVFLKWEKINKKCNEQILKFGIKTPNMNQIIMNLSGGNQQKVLFARWLMTDPEIIILDEPTRGIDVGAKSEIHRIITNLAKQGKSIILISSELPEILGMSDRIVIMHEGAIKGIIDREHADQTEIMKHAFNL